MTRQAHPAGGHEFVAVRTGGQVLKCLWCHRFRILGDPIVAKLRCVSCGQTFVDDRGGRVLRLSGGAEEPWCSTCEAAEAIDADQPDPGDL